MGFLSCLGLSRPTNRRHANGGEKVHLLWAWITENARTYQLHPLNTKPTDDDMTHAVSCAHQITVLQQLRRKTVHPLATCLSPLSTVCFPRLTGSHCCV